MSSRLHDALAVDSLDKCGIYVRTTGSQVYHEPDSGDSWALIVMHLTPVVSVEVQSL